MHRQTRIALLLAGSCGLSVLAGSPPLPPPGHARPPFHLKLNDALEPMATSGPKGLSPAAVRHFYTFDQISNLGSGQIIGIVTAYDDPNIESDLGVFDTNYKL